MWFTRSRDLFFFYNSSYYFIYFLKELALAQKVIKSDGIVIGYSCSKCSDQEGLGANLSRLATCSADHGLIVKKNQVRWGYTNPCLVNLRGLCFPFNFTSTSPLLEKSANKSTGVAYLHICSSYLPTLQLMQALLPVNYRWPATHSPPLPSIVVDKYCQLASTSIINSFFNSFDVEHLCPVTYSSLGWPGILQTRNKHLPIFHMENPLYRIICWIFMFIK